MTSFAKTSGMFALAIAVSAVVGCASKNTTSTAYTTDGHYYAGHDQSSPRYHSASPGPVVVVREPAPAPAPVAKSQPAPAKSDAQLANAKVSPDRSAETAALVTSGDWIRGSLAFPTGTRQTSALLVEQAIPAEIMVGRPFDHEIKVTNISSVKLDDVEVEEAIPAGYKLTGDVPDTTFKDGVIRYQVGDLAPGASKTVMVKGAVSAAGPFSTCTSATYKSALCMTAPVVAPALKLAKTAPAEVMICDVIPMKLTVTNSGSGTARNVRIEDALPAGMTTEDGRTTVAFDVGTLASGQSKDIVYNAKVNKIGKYESKALAKAESGLTADSNAVATLVRQPILEIAKSGPAKAFAGRPVTYDITVTNKGDAVAANTQLTDAIPAGAKFDAASDSGRAGGTGVQWNLGDLQPGQSKKVSVTLAGGATGLIKSEATAQAKCATAVTAAAQTEIAGIPALLLECVDITDPIEVGQQETYVITVTNQGSAIDTNIKITCGLEEPMQYVSSSGATTGAADGKTISFAPLASLAPKAKAEWRVVVKAVNTGDVRFKVDMGSDQLTRPVNETESSNFYK